MHIDPEDVALCVADDGVPGASPAGGESRGDLWAAPDGARPTATPIVQTSLFTFPTFQALIEGLSAEHRHTVYTRGQNPTVAVLEGKLALLERGEACKCFASGMAAINAVMTGLLRSGDHVLFVNNTYGPTLQLAEHLARFGVEHDLLLDGTPDAVRAALRPNTALVWLESPGTMLFRVVDVAGIAAVARERGVLTCMDNSWSTPLLQKPLAAGVDIVVHSCTKYLAGHSDLVAGAVVSTAERMEELFYRAFLLNGGLLAPFDAWLLLRGLRTLPARLRQHEADALAVARFLEGHPGVRRVHHPALAGGIAAGENVGALAGTSGLFSFELVRDDFDSVSRVLNALDHIHLGVSWGGVESLAISPSRPGNGPELDGKGIPRGLIRLSVGLEGADVLMADLDAALATVS
ncbi:MAG: aminotransferase class I/II-fold pyridoxal phosphate-dependent enzyme [Gemmatimonadota bacterium]